MTREEFFETMGAVPPPTVDQKLEAIVSELRELRAENKRLEKEADMLSARVQTLETINRQPTRYLGPPLRK